MRINTQTYKMKVNSFNANPDSAPIPAPQKSEPPTESLRTKIPTHAFVYSAITLGLTVGAFLVGKSYAKK